MRIYDDPQNVSELQDLFTEILRNYNKRDDSGKYYITMGGGIADDQFRMLNVIQCGRDLAVHTLVSSIKTIKELNPLWFMDFLLEMVKLTGSSDSENIPKSGPFNQFFDGERYGE